MKKLFDILLLGIFGVLMHTTVVGQSAYQSLRNGDRAYDEAQYENAEAAYREASITDPSAQAKFNLANTLYQQEAYDEAAAEYEQAIYLSDDSLFRAKAYYNKGNSEFKLGKMEEAIKSYKKSLLLDATDSEAKENYLRALALQEMQNQQQKENNQDQQQNQEKQQDQEQQSSDQNDQSDSESEQSQDQQEQQEQSEQDEADQENNQQDQQPSLEEGEDQSMDENRAEQLLQLIDKADAEVQQKIRQKSKGKKTTSKPW